MKMAGHKKELKENNMTREEVTIVLEEYQLKESTKNFIHQFFLKDIDFQEFQESNQELRDLFYRNADEEVDEFMKQLPKEYYE